MRKFLIGKFDWIIVKPDEKAEKSEGGIHLPDDAKDKPKRGVVITKGPGRFLECGRRVAIEIDVGNVVHWTLHGGHNFEFEGEWYVALSEKDILCIEGVELEPVAASTEGSGRDSKGPRRWL